MATNTTYPQYAAGLPFHAALMLALSPVQPIFIVSEVLKLHMLDIDPKVDVGWHR